MELYRIYLILSRIYTHHSNSLTESILLRKDISMTNTTFNTVRSKVLILVSICLAAVVLPLSFTGGVVATPMIGHTLGGSATALTWITNAFMLSFGSLLMATGVLADKFGRKRMFILGMTLFIITSLVLSMCSTVVWLDALRAIQGIAAAAALSGGSSALAQEFEGHARTRAFSMLGTSFGVGLAFGPLMAGALIDIFGWPSIFFAIAGIGTVALILGMSQMRETRDSDAAGFDWLGMLTFTGALSLFTFSVIEVPESGWTSPKVMTLLIASLVLSVIFIFIELRVTKPMLDLSLFRYPRFIGVQMLPIGTCYCYIVLIVLLPLRFIGVGGYSEIEAGQLMLALSAPLLVIPMLVASLTRWISASVLCGIGFLIAAIGLYLLGLINDGHSGYAVIIAMLLIGIGAGMPWGLMDGLAISVVPKERAGMATGIFNTTRVASEGVALAITVALLSTFASMKLQFLLSNGASSVTALRITEASQHIAVGDLSSASVMLPEISHNLLLSSYTNAFQSLTHVLIIITLLSAVIAFFFLNRTSHTNCGYSDNEHIESKSDTI